MPLYYINHNDNVRSIYTLFNTLCNGIRKVAARLLADIAVGIAVSSGHITGTGTCYLHNNSIFSLSR